MVCFLAGGALGLAAQVRATYTATSYVRSDVAANDALSQEAAGRRVRSLVDRTEVFERAATALSVDAADLERRTRVAAQPWIDVVGIAVSSRDPEQAVDQANGLASASVAEDAARRRRDLREVRDRTTTPSPDGASEAERARRATPGQASLVAVTDGVTAQGPLSVVRVAARDRVAKTSSTLIAVMGAIGGILAGLGVVILFGGRTGRVSSSEELRELYPGTTVIGYADIPGVAAAEDGHPTSVVVTAVDGETEKWVDVVTSAIEGRAGYPRVVGVRPGSRPVQGPVPDGALLIVGVMLRTTRVRDVDDVLSNAPDGTYLLAGS